MIGVVESNLIAKELDKDVVFKAYISRELKNGLKEDGETVGDALVENGKLEAVVKVVNEQFGY
jgi:hypothetical protein